MRERPVSAVPRPIVFALLVAVAAQLVVSTWRTSARATAADLPAPPPAEVLAVGALGEQGVLARLGMQWLLAFDFQPGISLSFHELDYARVEAWLDRFLALDPDFELPLLAAARIYGEVADAVKQRRMITFVQQRFAADPATRWRYLAHAVFLAKHRLGDLELALELARELAAADPGVPIPGWARQMHIFVLEDMGELESARVILGGLLEGGEITDPHERAFLARRLETLAARAGPASAQEAAPVGAPSATK